MRPQIVRRRSIPIIMMKTKKAPFRVLFCFVGCGNRTRVRKTLLPDSYKLRPRFDLAARTTLETGIRAASRLLISTLVPPARLRTYPTFWCLLCAWNLGRRLVVI